MITVNFERLLDMSKISNSRTYSWDGLPSISIEDILAAKNIGVCGNPRPFGDSWRHPPVGKHSRDYHIERIIYFIEHPEEISGIEVDNDCDGGIIYPSCCIIDGWHRIAAGCALALDRVDIEYGGRHDIEDYLTEKTDVRPNEVLVLY